MTTNKEELIKLYEICDVKSLPEIIELFPNISKYDLKKIKSTFSKFKKNEKENIEYCKSHEHLSRKELQKELELSTNIIPQLEILFDFKSKLRPNSFTLQEIDFIKNNYRKLGVEECAKRLNISKRRLICFASKNNILGATSFSEEEKKEIKRLNKQGYTAIEIAIKLNRSIKTIYNFLYNNGLNVNLTETNSNRFKPSAPELYIINKMGELLNIEFPDKTKKENRSYYWNVVGKYEIDLPIYINDLKFAIEYDGEYWHNNKKEHDKIKDQALKEAGFIVYRIKSSDHKQNLKTLDPLLEQLAIEIMDLVKRFELTGNSLELHTPTNDSDIH